MRTTAATIRATNQANRGTEGASTISSPPACLGLRCMRRVQRREDNNRQLNHEGKGNDDNCQEEGGLDGGNGGVILIVIV
jgi:hypothetical protein